MTLKLLAEITLLALLGQWLLGLLAGARRDGNLFYRTFQIVTQPVVKLVRCITPRVVLDRHIPLAAFLLMLLTWLLATVAKINLCLELGVQACR